jgi:hypothetical protein
LPAGRQGESQKVRNKKDDDCFSGWINPEKMHYRVSTIKRNAKYGMIGFMFEKGSCGCKSKKHVILTKILLKITWIHKNLKINRTQFHFDY